MTTDTTEGIPNPLPDSVEPTKPKPTLWQVVQGAILQGIAVGMLLGTGFAGGFLFHEYAVQPATTETSYELLTEIEAKLETYFLYDIPDEQTRVQGAAEGLVAAYADNYTFYVPPAVAEVDSGNLAGRFGGIGAELGFDPEGRVILTRVYRDNPAYKAGLRDNDIVLAIDGIAVSSATHDMNGVIALIRGDIGDEVVLTALRDGDTQDYTVIRSEVLVPSVFWRILEEEPRIGYVQLTRFTNRAPEEVRQALTELEDQGAKAIILDLRGNGGGLVDAAINIAGEFLDGGVILYEQRRNQPESVYNAPGGGAALTIPLVLLVDENTASASEIVAGALQDRERAVVIGHQTFGKGSVQFIEPLSDGSSLHITTAQWFTPDHNRIEGQGLMPDIVIDPVDGQDAPLAKAIEILVEMISGGDAASR